MPIDSRSFIAEDVQLSAADLVVEFVTGKSIPCGFANKATWQWEPNTNSACVLLIEKSNDNVNFVSAGATLTNVDDAGRFTSVVAVESNFQRARITTPTALDSRGVVSARFWAEV